ACVPLDLADPSFYHLDTAFCPLPCGGVIYHPGAFTAEARAAIERRVAPADRIALGPADAARFAANAVCFRRVLVLSSCSDWLRGRQRDLLGERRELFGLLGHRLKLMLGMFG